MDRLLEQTNAPLQPGVALKMQREFYAASEGSGEKAAPTKELVQFLSSCGVSGEESSSSAAILGGGINSPPLTSLTRGTTTVFMAPDEVRGANYQNDEYARLARRLYSRQMNPDLDAKAEL